MKSPVLWEGVGVRGSLTAGRWGLGAQFPAPLSGRGPVGLRAVPRAPGVGWCARQAAGPSGLRAQFPAPLSGRGPVGLRAQVPAPQG
ncbi:hypothetical protein GCM10010469_13790 [Streptomyces labedae]|uniref:Uncharacterized protein n=1 Tax=Streptomyces labedae TaxID=285569 RepID=A0ABP6QTF1_9ACTN